MVSSSNIHRRRNNIHGNQSNRMYRALVEIGINITASTTFYHLAGVNNMIFLFKRLFGSNEHSEHLEYRLLMKRKELQDLSDQNT